MNDYSKIIFSNTQCADLVPSEPKVIPFIFDDFCSVGIPSSLLFGQFTVRWRVAAYF